jgi:hypothetical protein
VPTDNAKLRRLTRRILGVLVLAVAAIYALVRALHLDVARLLGYLGGSALLVVAAALAALVVAGLVRLVRGRFGRAAGGHGSEAKKRSSRGA